VRRQMKSRANGRSAAQAPGQVPEENLATRPARGHVTLRDVAIAAGVSPMTVSNYINARLGTMSPKTRARIEAVVDRLGYRPHTVGRNLRLSKRLSVDMVIIDDAPLYLADPFTTHIVAGLSNRLNSNGYALQLQASSAEAFQTSSLVRNLRSDAICVLLSGPDTTRRKIVSTLLQFGQPIVAFQETFAFHGADLCVIRQDDREGGRMIAREVLRRGVRRLVMLIPGVVWPAITERVAGVSEVVAAAEGGSAEGGAAELRIVTCGRADYHDTQSALSQDIDAHGYPEAILAGNDQMGIAAMKLMASRNRRVPSEVAITGFNAFDFWQFTDPVLTTIRSPAYEMGVRGAEEILSHLDVGHFTRHNIVFPVVLQRGGST
jgi:LacI family transcriptional regulator